MGTNGERYEEYLALSFEDSQHCTRGCDTKTVAWIYAWRWVMVMMKRRRRRRRSWIRPGSGQIYSCSILTTVVLPGARYVRQDMQFTVLYVSFSQTEIRTRCPVGISRSMAQLYKLLSYPQHQIRARCHLVAR